MPIYEYYCEKCDETFEIFQRISDDPKSDCDVCGGHLKKQISLSTFHLKGSGWYATDYAKGKKNGNGTDKKEKSTPDAKADSADTAPKSESKSGGDKPQKAKSTDSKTT